MNGLEATSAIRALEKRAAKTSRSSWLGGPRERREKSEADVRALLADKVTGEPQESTSVRTPVVAVTAAATASLTEAYSESGLDGPYCTDLRSNAGTALGCRLAMYCIVGHSVYYHRRTCSHGSVMDSLFIPHGTDSATNAHPLFHTPTSLPSHTTAVLQKPVKLFLMEATLGALGTPAHTVVEIGD
jgi:hypothetical protein